MSNPNRERPDIHTRVCGIPCGIVIDSYHRQEPVSRSPEFCETDFDYYGDFECEWHLVDRRGYPAPWLEEKMGEGDREEVEREIENQC